MFLKENWVNIHEYFNYPPHEYTSIFFIGIRYEFFFSQQVNEEILNSNCQSKTICKPGGVLATQTLPPCQKYSTCSIDNGQRTCLCDMGFVLRNGKCTPKGNSAYTFKNIKLK